MIHLFDAHLHIIDYQFPLIANQGYLPDEFVATDYLMRAKHLQIIGGAVISGSFQAFDQAYLVNALSFFRTKLCWSNTTSCSRKR